MLGTLNGSLSSLTVLEHSLTHISKARKMRNELKKWRTLSKSIYKCMSSMVANRIKPTPPSVIKSGQA